MEHALEALKERFREEPFAKFLGIELVELEFGRAVVKLITTGRMDNLFSAAHGGVIFSLLDSAFELASNSHGTISVALSVNVNYLLPVPRGSTIFAEAGEVSRSSRISTYQIQVTSEDGKLIATCQAMAYRKKDKLPFL